MNFKSGFWWPVIIFVLLVCATQEAAAQNEQEELQTDRPDQTESSAVVPKKTVQLETGYYFEKNIQGANEFKSHAYPTALLRIGVLERLELLLLAAYKDSVIENHERRKIKGMGPLSVGAKAQLWKEKGWRPEAALLFRVLLPTGARHFRPSAPEPHLRLNLSHQLSNNMQLAYNLVHGWVEGNSEPGYTISLSRDLSDKVTLFVEVFGQKEEGEGAAHQADAGVLFLLLPNLQIDVACGTTLNSEEADYFITTGVSVRLPY